MKRLLNRAGEQGWCLRLGEASTMVMANAVELPAQVSEWFMPECSPNARETARLLGLLRAYDRPELWLRVRHYYQLEDQPDQVLFDVVDAVGNELADRSGRTLPHTLQVTSPSVSVVPGQLVHLRRDGDEVRICILPVVSVVSTALLSSQAAESQGHVLG